MNDYSTLDAQIIKAINTAALATATAIEFTVEVKEAAEPFLTRTRCLMRIVDGRLQSLKRRGLIKFNRNERQWEVIK